MKSFLVVLALYCLTSIAAADVIRLVTGNDYQPYTDESLPKRGMVTEIVELAFQAMGYESHIVFRPWKRGYLQTKAGDFVGTFPYIKSEERLRDFYFSDPIHTMYIRIFVAKDSPIHRVSDLNNKRLCVPLGYAVSKHLSQLVQLNTDKKDVNPTDLVGCLRMIQAGRKDFFVINEINGWTTIQQTFNTKKHFRTLNILPEEETHHLIISKTYPGGKKIVSIFNQGLEKLRAKGILDRIINRHIEEVHNR